MEQTNMILKYLIVKFRLYLLLMNVLSLFVFMIFIKGLYNMNNTRIINQFNLNSITITFGVISILSILINMEFIRKRLKIKSFLKLTQLFQYIKELTLAFISFYYFTKVSNNSYNQFNYYFLLTITIYFSTIGILNCVLIDELISKIDQTSPSGFKLQNFSFLFLFRYFYFLSKLMGFALFLTSYNDNFNQDHQNELKNYLFMFLIFTAYLLISFSVYFFVYLYYIYQNQNDILIVIIKCCFESFKMLIDFNHEYFESKNRIFSSTKWFRIMSLILYMSFQIFIQFLCWYVWYFNAFFIFNQIKTTTSLLSLLASSNSRLSLINLIELEQKLKTRQLEFIIIVGSIIISMLSYHIYYTYYFEEPIEKPKTSIQNHNHTISNASQDNDSDNLNTVSSIIDKIDGFSIDSFKQSSSIASNSIRSASLPCLYSHPELNACSTCYTSSVDRNMNDSQLFYSDTTLSNTTYSTFEIRNTDKFNKRFDQLYNVKNNNFLSNYSKNIDIYDTSSGVISSESSSLSSIYNNYTTGQTHWSSFPSNNLNNYLNSRNSINQTYSDKVTVWMTRTNLNCETKKTIANQNKPITKTNNLAAVSYFI